MKLGRIFVSTIEIVCGVVILIGFIALPFMDVKSFFSALGSNSSAYQFVSYLTAQGNNNGLFATLAPIYGLYIFVGIAILLILRGIIRLFLRPKKRIHILSVLRRILMVIILYGLIPIAVMGGFYRFNLNYTQLTNMQGIPYSLSDILQIARPQLGAYLMVIGSIIGGTIAVLRTIRGIFIKDTA